MVPPPVPSAIPRLALSVNEAVASSVPPANTSCPAVAAPGAVPRRVSLSIAILPALMVVTPL